MISKALVVAAAFAIASTATMAAGVNGATASKDKRITSVPSGSSHYTPAQLPGKTPNVIFNNIGWKYPNGLYFCCYGDTISGSTSQIGQTFWLAASFSPSEDATVKEIDAGVGWVSGANKVEITLYDDNGGVPGNVIATGEASALGVFGDCCGLASMRIKGGAAVTGGSTYWVAVTTDGAASNTWAAWNFNSTDQINPVSVAASNGAGWTNLGGSVPAPSFAVIASKR